MSPHGLQSLKHNLTAVTLGQESINQSSGSHTLTSDTHVPDNQSPGPQISHTQTIPRSRLGMMHRPAVAKGLPSQQSSSLLRDDPFFHFAEHSFSLVCSTVLETTPSLAELREARL